MSAVRFHGVRTAYLRRVHGVPVYPWAGAQPGDVITVHEGVYRERLTTARLSDPIERCGLGMFDKHEFPRQTGGIVVPARKFPPSERRGSESGRPCWNLPFLWSLSRKRDISIRDD
jgi:hypothetical protein